MTAVAALFLVVGVVCYGLAGANLHAGANAQTSALRSRSWWLGTGLQGAGFLSMLASRISLPLLLVQAGSTAGLAVSALVQHVTGVRRLSALDAAAIGAVVLGLGAIAATTEPGPAAAATPGLLILLAALCLIVGPLALIRLPGVVAGLASGVGFSVGAIAGRLAVGDHANPLWLFWRLPWTSWACLVLAAAGIVIGQIHLTRGLRGREAAPVLGAMYFVATVLPAVVGVALLHELPRPGSAPLAVVGVLLAAAGIGQLLRSGRT